MPGAAARSAVFAFADRYVSDRAALDPIHATGIGIEGYDHLLPDFSMRRWERDAESSGDALRQLEGIEPTDDIDRIAKSVMVERLTATLALEQSGELARTFSVISSPVTDIRQVFELMRADTAEDLARIQERLSAVRTSLSSWRGGLSELVGTGVVLPRRQVRGVAAQAAVQAEGAFAGFAAGLEARSQDLAGLRAAAADADAACGELAAWLVDDLAGASTDLDAAGPERYARWSQYFLGATPELDELYEWGWQDLQRINTRMRELATGLAPGAATLAEVAAVLDADDTGAIFGTDALIARLEAFTAATVEALDGVHFDIDERIRRCDARIAPDGSAAAPYYIAPSEDLSRPGTTWFPTLGETRFPWWRLASTWYHESVPGHHLESGNCFLLGDRLSRFQRLDAWTSGYGEGWALYAERLMDELGAFSEPAVEMGYLCGQGLRAARIVVDLGLHLGFAAPRDLGTLGDLGDCSGQPWSAEMAVALLVERALEDHAYAVSEVDRYLGSPAQAISYKVGERTWLEAREAARQRLGDRFELKRFHAYALGLGPMGLDPFCDELARWDGT